MMKRMRTCPARAFSEYYTLFMLLDLNPQAYAQLAIYMGPIRVPIWGVQLGSIWVPYGLAHGNNKVNSRSRGGSRIS